MDPEGQLQARYRKIHLFDVDLDDGTRLLESETTAAGDAAVVADLPCGRTGLTICYDLRFPPLYRSLVDASATVLTAPSAFTAAPPAAITGTCCCGPGAIECQSWMLAAAQVGAHGGGRVSFGHSLAVDPWGRVRLDLGTEPGVGLVEVDPEQMTEIRARLPSLRHARPFRAPEAG
ncbi:MAG: nitrilase-related carbon-nitrogen hydrolase [Gammaproteobacteria bacterium]|nr:nitrilase-related carbon-nitrogen hydrolase [Gammaproteobacteria bacterium]